MGRVKRVVEPQKWTTEGGHCWGGWGLSVHDGAEFTKDKEVEDKDFYLKRGQSGEK